MKRALLLLSWLFLRTWKQHPVRQGLTVLSIALGVALYLSTELTTGSIAHAVEQAAGVLAGGVDLTVSRDSAGIAEEELRALEARPEFAGVSGIVQVNAMVASSGPAVGSRLTIVGVDPVKDAKVRELHGRVRFGPGGPVAFLTDPTALVLSENGAERLGGLGQHLELTTPSGTRQFTVAGIVEVPREAREAAAELALVPLHAAQKLFGREGRVDRVDLRLAAGTPRAAGERVARAAAPGAAVQTPGEATSDTLSAIKGFRAVLLMNSMLALLVALFFIYNTVSAAAAERTREAGLLRSLGLTRLGLHLLFGGEAAAAGLLGFAAGSLLGLVLARTSLSLVAQTVGVVYFQVPPVSGISPTGTELMAAGALGIGIAVIAAWLASHRLASRSPLEILHPGLVGASAGRRLLRVGMLGLALIAISVALPWIMPPRGGMPTGRIVALVLPSGIALTAPALVLAIAGRLRDLLSSRSGPSLWLALDAARTHPSRTAATVTAFALSLGLVIGHGGMARAMMSTLGSWLAETIPGDIILGTAPSPVSVFPFSDEAVLPLAELPGVESVFRMRNTPIHVGGRRTMCLALDLAVARTRSRHRFLAGDPDDIYRRTIAGEAVFVSENLAWKAALRPGDVIPIEAAGGRVELPISGVIRDFNSPLGTVFMDLALYRRLFRDPLIDFGELILKKEALGDIQRVARAAHEALSAKYPFINVVPRDSFVAQALAVIDDLNNLSFVQMALAVVIGCVGILVTVTLSILTRTRELALLRAVGMDPAGLARTVLYEVAGLATASAIAGVIIGNLIFLPGNLLFRELSGFVFGYSFPALHVALAVAIAFVTALLSAIVPLRHLKRIDVLRAMEEE